MSTGTEQIIQQIFAKSVMKIKLLNIFLKFVKHDQDQSLLKDEMYFELFRLFQNAFQIFQINGKCNEIEIRHFFDALLKTKFRNDKLVGDQNDNVVCDLLRAVEQLLNSSIETKPSAPKTYPDRSSEINSSELDVMVDSLYHQSTELASQLHGQQDFKEKRLLQHTDEENEIILDSLNKIKELQRDTETAFIQLKIEFEKDLESISQVDKDTSMELNDILKQNDAKLKLFQGEVLVWKRTLEEAIE